VVVLKARRFDNAAEMDPSYENARRFILEMREELEAREGP